MKKLRLLTHLMTIDIYNSHKRICAQEFPDTAPQDYLIHCRNLVIERFNEKGPWPDA